ISSNITSQLMDIDKDGSWDMLLFQLTIEAQKTERFSLEWFEKGEYPAFKQLTNVFLGYSEKRDGNYISLDQRSREGDRPSEESPYSYQFEGPGWESNLVAYRHYFDTRNGKDIFGKTTEDMIVNSIGLGENYHQLQPWGMDILKVGTSLGAGALAMYKNDSLVRLGVTKEASFTKLHAGPLLSSFQLTYSDWKVLDENYDMEETITITANSRFYQSEIVLKSQSENRIDTLVTGIVNFHNADLKELRSSGMTALTSHSERQSENKDALGMAILAHDDAYLGASKAPAQGAGITKSELVYLKPKSGKYQFYFYTGWELEADQFADQEQFRVSVESTMRDITAELKVQIR
ncbi:MAG: DUF4861 family protein, partial [Bacteroidota bacterium]